MAKFCKKCGNMLDENSGICKVCNPTGVLTENELVLSPKVKNDISNSKIKEKHNEKKKTSKKNRRKNLFLKILSLALVVVVVAFSATVAMVYFDVVDIPVISQLIDRITKSSAEEEFAFEIVTAFKTDDIEKINDILFSDDKVVLDENIGVSFDNSAEDTNIEQKNGMLSEIFSYVEISYDGIEGQQFVYTIKSPNMSGVFDNVLELQTEDELVEHICDYAKEAKTVKNNVAVAYVNNQGEIIADYQTEAFINAITGGLADEYKKVYTQYINELLANER